jgi:signal peptidase
MDATKVFNLIKKVVCWILYGVFGIVFFVTSWLFVDKFIRKSPVPSFLGYSMLIIQTGSMSGTMEIGDMIIIKDTGDYKIGEIITFMPDGAVVPTTHRIINYTATGEFVTKGDANNVKDTDNTTTDQILGEVVMHLPKLGQFASWVQVEGWMYIIATIGIIFLGVFMVKSAQDETPVKASVEGENTADTTDQSDGENVVETADTTDQIDGENVVETADTTDQIDGENVVEKNDITNDENNGETRL